MYIFMVVENLIAEFTYQINTTLKLIHRVHIGLKWFKSPLILQQRFL